MGGVRHSRVMTSQERAEGDYFTDLLENTDLTPLGVGDIYKALLPGFPEAPPELGKYFSTNMAYFMKISRDKMFQQLRDPREDDPERVWTMDAWNEAMAAMWERVLGVMETDPDLRPVLAYCRMSGYEVFCSGSIAERTATTKIGMDEGRSSDVDVMYSTPLLGDLWDANTLPGFTRILLDPDDSVFPKDEKNFMLAADFSLGNLDAAAKGRGGAPPHTWRAFHSLTGPAIAFSTHEVKSLDLVHSFYRRDRQWPVVAEEWIRRHRPSGWPSAALIIKAVSQGTYVVPVAHPHSPSPKIEWRYSFSKAEIDLMRSVTKKQRKCFMLVKRLCNLTFSGFRLLKSYHVKTAFLWLAEGLAEFWWEQMSMVELVDYFLFELERYFAEGNLPNYFIRKANLIDHLPPEHRRTVIQKLEKLRWEGPKGYPEYIITDEYLFEIKLYVEPNEEELAKFVKVCQEKFPESGITKEKFKKALETGHVMEHN